MELTFNYFTLADGFVVFNDYSHLHFKNFISMKSVFTFLSLLVVLSLTAQRVGIPMNQRQNFDPPVNPSFIYSLPNKKTTVTLEKSIDTGWQKSADEVIANNHRIYSVDMVDSSIIWMVSTYDDFPPPADEVPYVLKSLDGGVTWEQYAIPNTEGKYAFDIAAVNAQTAYVIINDESFSDDEFGDFIFQTQDGGISWTAIENYPYSPIFIHFFDENKGWAMGSDTAGVGFIVMSVTDDGGITWNHAGGDNWTIPEGRSLPAQDSTEFVGTWGFSVNSVYEAADSVIILGGSKRYWISEDYGYNWQNFDSPLAPSHSISMVAIKSRDTFMLASNISQDFSTLLSPLIFSTTDGGETWIQSETDGHLSAIHYLPGTEQSFISIGHRDFGVGAVGTYRTDDLENWEAVDEVPLISMDFAGENQGTGALGNIPFLGDNGNIYQWGLPSLYAIGVEVFSSIDYTISKREHIEDILIDIEVENTGQLDLSTLEAVMVVTRGEEVVSEDRSTIAALTVEELNEFSFEYTPTEPGIYEYSFVLNNAELGEDISIENRFFELSDSTLAKDDGTTEADIGFGFGDPNWYGYYGSEFRLLEADTLQSIDIRVSLFSDLDATYQLGVYEINEVGEVEVEPLYNSGEIAAFDALSTDGTHTHQLSEPLPLPPGQYVFAAGQDTLQGIVGFGFDTETVNEGYWIVSPIAGGGYPWSNLGNSSLPTLAIRANFQQSGIISSVQEWNSSPAPFQVFPNPFSDQLNLAFTEGNHSSFWIELTDVQGKVLLTQQIVRDSLLNQNWKHLASGLYFLKVTDGKQTWVEKVVKE